MKYMAPGAMHASERMRSQQCIMKKDNKCIHRSKDKVQAKRDK